MLSHFMTKQHITPFEFYLTSFALIKILSISVRQRIAILSLFTVREIMVLCSSGNLENHQRKWCREAYVFILMEANRHTLVSLSVLPTFSECS